MTSGDHELVERLLIQLARFSSIISDALATSTASTDPGGAARLLVLCLLDIEGPQRPGTLQDLVGLSSGGTSKLLDRMERADLVRRSYGTIDRDNRGVEVNLTDTGRALIRQTTTAVATALPESKTVLKEIMAIIEDLDR